MIKSEKGKVIMEGSTVAILADLAIAIRAVKDGLEDRGVPDEEVRELIALSGKRAFMTAEQLDAEEIILERETE